MRDKLISFSIKNSDFVGKIIVAENSLINADNSLEYPDIIGKLLSELRVIVSLIGSSLKHNGSINIVLQSDKYFNFITADYFDNGFVRSYATLRGDKEIPDSLSFSELINQAKLMITINFGHHDYQGIVEISGKENLSEAVEKYFNESVQIPTYVQLMTDFNENNSLKIWGLIVQNIRVEKEDRNLQEQSWQKIGSILNFKSFQQIIEKNESIESNLSLLFAEYGVEIYEENYVKFGCKCSDKKFQEIFTAMSREDIQEAEKRNMVEINCEFCGKTMAFNSKIQ